MTTVSPTSPTQSATPTSVTPPDNDNRLNLLVAEMLREQQIAAIRLAFAREHLADLPEAYRRLLPETDDVAALAVAGEQLRQQFRGDVRSFLHAREVPLFPDALDDDPLFSGAD